ncbi:MAG TPA: marine proteobacterial sortase target protein, partial [Rhodospirillales bacterium]|nr:marine proteobacterial sortase target protein [Rhodospirillales bacterium]
KDVQRGGLFFQTEKDGLFQPAPNLGSHVEGHVSGMVARYAIHHRFRNPGKNSVEGVYVFPLPEKAAVDSLRMRIGERLIEGRIQEKDEAKKTYDKAKKQGRPNIFTASIANIGPGEEVSIEIEFQQTLRYDNGEFSLRLPLVVGPRHIPGAAPLVTAAGSGWMMPIPKVQDAARIKPGVRSVDAGPGNPVSLKLELDSGFPLASFASPSHAIKTEKLGSGRYLITLKEGETPADRDFVFNWRPDVGKRPVAGLFSETIKGQSYLMLMLTPQTVESAVEAAAKAPPREVVFVIDASGSMHGESLSQAKEALLSALSRLRPGDKFNIIQFNSVTHRLFASARPAQAENLDRARVYVEGLVAEGGTEMLPALQAALDGSSRKGRMRQVVAITDGAVGNEDALFEVITAKLGDSRLFTIGIGSAPNGFFMAKAARYGRGAYTFIGDVARVKEKMTELFVKLENPALTDLRLTWPTDAEGRAKGDAEVEFWPDPLPDLYAGEPLVVLARIPALSPLAALEGKVSVAGTLGGRIWRTDVALDVSRQSPGVGRLWAREKIAGLEDAVRGGVDAESARQLAVRTALDHNLLSRYTSLAAVDVTPARPGDDTPIARNVPINTPAGWSREKVLGVSQGASPAASPGVFMKRASIGLPQTAASAPMNFVAGLAMALFGLTMLAWARRQA